MEKVNYIMELQACANKRKIKQEKVESNVQLNIFPGTDKNHLPFVRQMKQKQHFLKAYWNKIKLIKLLKIKRLKILSCLKKCQAKMCAFNLILL